MRKNKILILLLPVLVVIGAFGSPAAAHQGWTPMELRWFANVNIRIWNTAVFKNAVATNARDAAAVPTGRCGGGLPPCYVMERESGGNIRAENPTTTASGKWQFIDATWNGFGGYSHASRAPESVQDARARQVWAGGAGCANWAAC